MKVYAGHQSQKTDEFGAHVLKVKWKIEGCRLFFERKAVRGLELAPGIVMASQRGSP